MPAPSPPRCLHNKNNFWGKSWVPRHRTASRDSRAELREDIESATQKLRSELGQDFGDLKSEVVRVCEDTTKEVCQQMEEKLAAVKTDLENSSQAELKVLGDGLRNSMSSLESKALADVTATRGASWLPSQGRSPRLWAI